LGKKSESMFDESDPTMRTAAKSVLKNPSQGTGLNMESCDHTDNGHTDHRYNLQMIDDEGNSGKHISIFDPETTDDISQKRISASAYERKFRIVRNGAIKSTLENRSHGKSHDFNESLGRIIKNQTVTD